MPEAREMTTEEIADVVHRFVNAAVVLKEAGFAGVQLHAAHGYLLSSFLSPRANQRRDQFGCETLESRSLLLFEILCKCRAAVGPNFCIGVKLNSSDFQKGGFSAEESVIIAKKLEDDVEGAIDFIKISGGSTENPSMMLGPDGFEELKSLKQLGKATSTQLREGYFLLFATNIRRELKRVPLMVTGGFRSKAFMEAAIGGGGIRGDGGEGEAKPASPFSSSCDLIGIGRPLCGSHDCVGRMLRGEIDVLPRYENTIRNPFYLRFLDYLVVGHLIQLGGLQAWTYCNLRRMGEGVEPPTNEANCDIIKDKNSKASSRKKKAIARGIAVAAVVVGAALVFARVADQKNSFQNK